MLLRIQFTDEARPVMQRVMANLRDRRRIHQGMGRELQHAISDYTLTDSAGRHATAQRLGARPTNFRADAAKLVARPAALQLSKDGGAINLPAAHFARAFGSVHIVPKNGSRLITIPIDRAAYGKRAALTENITDDFGNQRHIVRKSRFKTTFWLKFNAHLFLCARNADNSLRFLYLGVPSVDQKQDRTLLPSDEAMTAAASYGGAQALERIVKETA